MYNLGIMGTFVYSQTVVTLLVQIYEFLSISQRKPTLFCYNVSTTFLLFPNVLNMNPYSMLGSMLGWMVGFRQRTYHRQTQCASAFQTTMVGCWGKIEMSPICQHKLENVKMFGRYFWVRLYVL